MTALLLSIRFFLRFLCSWYSNKSEDAQYYFAGSYFIYIFIKCRLRAWVHIKVRHRVCIPDKEQTYWNRFSNGRRISISVERSYSKGMENQIPVFSGKSRGILYSQIRSKIGNFKTLRLSYHFRFLFFAILSYAYSCPRN